MSYLTFIVHSRLVVFPVCGGPWPHPRSPPPPLCSWPDSSLCSGRTCSGLTWIKRRIVSIYRYFYFYSCPWIMMILSPFVFWIFLNILCQKLDLQHCQSMCCKLLVSQESWKYICLFPSKAVNHDDFIIFQTSNILCQKLDFLHCQSMCSDLLVLATIKLNLRANIQFIHTSQNTEEENEQCEDVQRL